MPIQAPQWTEFLSCPICFNIFDEGDHRPISLACGHTVCRICLSKLTPKKCPFDQNVISRAIEDLPVNFALLQLVGVAVPEGQETRLKHGLEDNVEFYNSARKCIEELAMYLKPLNKDSGSPPSPLLSRPMQRKLVTLVNCQLVEDEGRCRAVRAARSLGERTVTELILQHQNPQQLSANLWAGVRARGCQFLGPAMQEEVLKLILLALEDGSALSRKVLVLFVVQRLEAQYPQASKTAIGHVVQLLYRASCFKVTKRDEESSLMQLKEEFWTEKVTKRDEESSLMQLKEEFRTYEALRREHDSQIVQIATEAGLRISPEQWSALLYGDTAHKSHMQSIIDKLQTPQSFIQSISELTIALQRTGDPGGLAQLKPHVDLLSSIDPGPESISPCWETVHLAMLAIKTVVEGLVDFTTSRNIKKQDLMPLHNPKYKTSMCRDLVQKGKCPRGQSCTFAHSQGEMDKHRQRNKKAAQVVKSSSMATSNSTSTDMVTPPLYDDDDKMTFSIATTSLPLTVAVTVQAVRNKVDSICEMSPRSNCSDNEVNVPIVKPSSLPSTMRTKQDSSIYSSSDLKPAKDPLRTDVVSISKKMSASVQGNHHHSSPPSHHPPSSMVSHLPQNTHPQDSSATYLQSQASDNSYHPQQHWTLPGMGYDPGNMDESQIRQMITMMPANPYTIDRYGLNARDTVYYNSMAIRARGKSPSKQLEELQNRKRELLSQINKTKEPAVSSASTATSVDDNSNTTNNNYRASTSPSPPYSMASVISSSHTTPSSVYDTQPYSLVSIISSTQTTPSSGGRPVVSTESYYRSDSHGRSDLTSKPQSTGVSLAKSVADSKATTLINMTLSNQDEVEWVDYPKVSVSNGNSGYSAWSSASDDSNVHVYASSQDDQSSCHEQEVYWPPLEECTDDEMSESVSRYHRHVTDDEDEFVPLSEEAAISKYGPISRMTKTKVRQAAPVQVTAGQQKDTRPVTAVTPLKRPHPITSQVPSRFSTNSPSTRTSQGPPNPSTGSHGDNKVSTDSPALPQPEPGMPRGGHGDHRADPNGVYVAASLPTALMQPNVMGSVNRSEEPHTLWTLRQRIVDPKHRPTETASNLLGKDKLQNEIAHITNKIQNLQSSEDDRLIRELESIELNIVEAERQIEIENEIECESSRSTPQLPPPKPAATQPTTHHPAPVNYPPKQQQPPQPSNQWPPPSANQWPPPQPYQRPAPQPAGQYPGHTGVSYPPRPPQARMGQNGNPGLMSPSLPGHPWRSGSPQVVPPSQTGSALPQFPAPSSGPIPGLQHQQFQGVRFMTQMPGQAVMEFHPQQPHIQQQQPQQPHIQQQQPHLQQQQQPHIQQQPMLQNPQQQPPQQLHSQQLQMHQLFQPQQQPQQQIQPHPQAQLQHLHQHQPMQMQMQPHMQMVGGYTRMATCSDQAGGGHVIIQNGQQFTAQDAMDYQLAREAQLLAMSEQQARVVQESEDRRYAEDIAMQEVEKFVRASIAEDES